MFLPAVKEKQLLGTRYIIWHKVLAAWPFGKIGVITTTEKFEEAELQLKKILLFRVCVGSYKGRNVSRRSIMIQGRCKNGTKHLDVLEKAKGLNEKVRRMKMK